jgi:hypothetical protein
MSYTNADGLYILTDEDQGAVKDQGSTALFARKTMIVDIPDATAIPSSVATPAPNDPYIPAGAYITNAWLVVETAFTSAGSATLTIGTYNSAASAIDADGIDATVAKAALAANLAVACDGAQVGGTATVGAANAYVQMIYGTAVFTAGKGKLYIEYIEV